MMKEALQKDKPRTQAGKSRRRRLWKAAALGCCAAALCLLAVAGREASRHPDKLWLHRCNSLEKLEEKGGDYPNIEVDLVFRPDRTFDVTHDMETSFGLRLDAYFARMADTGGVVFCWTSRT